MPISISNHPQLFLDDHLVSRTRNLKRDVKQPVKHPANPLMRQEYDWENRYLWYVTVLYDEDWGKFRAWYMAAERPRVLPKYAVGYAESKDGLRWTKPMVGTEPFRNFTKHNIVIPHGHGVSVMKTPWDPDPDRLYKAVGGDAFAVSPDGIRWTCHDWLPAVGKNDTGQSFVWWKGEYLAYVRYQIFAETWPTLIRGIGLSVSKDFKRWTKKRLILEADEADGHPWGQPHALAVTAYGDVLIGLLPMMEIIPEVGNNLMGEMHVELASSRDGRKWHRVGDRARFMPQAKSERLSRRPWDLRFHPGSNMFVKDDQVYIYYVGSTCRWGEGSWRSGRLRFGGVGGRRRKVGKPDSQHRPFSLGLATLPADRFVSLRPVNFEAEGTLQTKPLLFSGKCDKSVKNLLVNADVEPGELQVELLDAHRKVLPGFGRQDSKLVRHDKLRYSVRWRGGKTLRRAPLDQPLSLRFILRNGDLFAFQVVK